ncbi:MAG: sulfatase/phosphatase domain-containing protein [Tunicatimonas sp.]
MKRLSSLIFFLVLGVATAWAQPTLEMSRRAEAKPRNVIFILSDDHRFDYMGFTGKVPFLMRYPEALAGGQVIEKMVQNIDVAPTVLEVAGINQPEQMQGRSMVPILKGKKPTGTTVFSTNTIGNTPFRRRPPCTGCAPTATSKSATTGCGTATSFTICRETPTRCTT